jgi:hypothetical protein
MRAKRAPHSALKRGRDLFPPGGGCNSRIVIVCVVDMGRGEERNARGEGRGKHGSGPKHRLRRSGNLKAGNYIALLLPLFRFT